MLFSTRLHGLLQLTRPLLRALRVERPLRKVYLALHSFRRNARLLGSMFALTLVVQAVRVLAILCAGKAVRVELSPPPHHRMGPLLLPPIPGPLTGHRRSGRASLFLSFLRPPRVFPHPAV